MVFKIPNKIILKSDSAKSVFLFRKSDDNDASTNTLDAIIKAIKLNKSSDILIEYLDEQSKFVLSGIDQFANIVLFGLTPQDIGCNIKFGKYQIIPFGQSKLIVSDSIIHMSKNADLKPKLWKCLQEIYLK